MVPPMAAAAAYSSSSGLDTSFDRDSIAGSDDAQDNSSHSPSEAYIQQSGDKTIILSPFLASSGYQLNHSRVYIRQEIHTAFSCRTILICMALSCCTPQILLCQLMVGWNLGM
jgi:hypothetical protein